MQLSLRPPLLLQFASVFFSAGSVILAKIALSTLAIGPFLFIFALTSVLVCAPLVDKRSLKLFLGGQIGWYAILSNIVGLSAFYYGLTGLHPGTHSLISRSYVAFGFFFSWAIFRERFGPVRGALACLCVVSSLLAGAPAQSSVIQWLPATATLFAAACFALNYALLRMIPAGIASATPILIYNAALIPFALFHMEGGGALQGVALTALLYAMACAMLAVVSLYLYLSSATQISFFTSTALRTCSPFLVILLGQQLFPLILTVENAIGILLMPCLLFFIAFYEFRSTREQ